MMQSEHYDCKNRTEFGYSKTTACIEQKYQDLSGEALIPSHTCAGCGKHEYPNAIIGTTVFWLCDDCTAKLKKLISEVK